MQLARDILYGKELFLSLRRREIVVANGFVPIARSKRRLSISALGLESESESGLEYGSERHFCVYMRGKVAKPPASRANKTKKRLSIVRRTTTTTA